MPCSRRCCGAGGREQAARGLRAETVVGREQLVRRFLDAANEYPWDWGPAHVEEWSLC